jgi:hypothetical protein
MKDNKIKTETDRLILEKRRKYMRAYYLRTKTGKSKPKEKKKSEYTFNIKRGSYLVFFE